MSGSLMDMAVCCLACTECFRTIELSETENKETTNIEKNKDINYKRMEDVCLARIVVDYTFEDKRCVKNEKGEIFCGFCKKTIPDPMVSLLQCGECKRYIGHPICFLKAGKKCIFCRE